jgi:hypothetical protein
MKARLTPYRESGDASDAVGESEGRSPSVT